MIRIFAISIAHMMPEIIACSLAKGRRTMGPAYFNIAKWIVVDNHWPIDRDSTHLQVKNLAGLVDGELISPEKNVGGHGGINYAVDHLKKEYALTPDDLILIYDPDSNPAQDGWLQALVSVMSADPNMPYLSLLHEAVAGNRKWVITPVNGINVARDAQAEMFNVTLFRAGVLMREHGLKAPNKWYGGIESELFNAQNLRGAYLFDFRENENPIPHPAIYTKWKWDHAHNGSYPGNFDAYCIDHGIA